MVYVDEVNAQTWQLYSLKIKSSHLKVVWQFDNLRLVLTSDGVEVGVVIRSAELNDLVKTAF